MTPASTVVAQGLTRASAPGGFVAVATRTSHAANPRARLFGEEPEELCCRLVGSFLSNEMTAVERATTQFTRALSPDRADVVGGADPGLAPQEQRRAGELVVRISLVVPKVDARTGSVVLAG